MPAPIDPLTAARVPLTLDAAARGDLSPLRSLSGTVSTAFGGITDGAFLSLLCSEDVARLDPENAEHVGEGTFLRGTWRRALIETCRAWPLADVPEDFHASLETDTPILSLTGVLDPSMPPTWGEGLAASLPEARHLTIPHAPHGLLGMRGARCVVDLIDTFVRAGSARDLDTSCLAEVQGPPFAPP